MVVSGLLIKPFFWICWHIRRIFRLLHGVVFYVESEHDYFVINNILPHLEFPYKIVARNQIVANKLIKRGLSVDVWPAFPRILVMTRHAFHRFPIKDIKKIGIKHGTYHFKKMVHPKKYNAFDLYIFTTEEETKMAFKSGIKSGIAGGQPKLDTLLSHQTLQMSKKIKQNIDFNENKKTLLFTATWDKTGLSAIDQWIDNLPELKSWYNILVSMHPMMSISYVNKVKSLPGIHVAESYNLPAYMHIADFLISDTSSIMGEFCALDKPIITFVVEKGWRLTPHIREMIKDISIQIKSIKELEWAVEQYLRNPDLKRAERRHWRKVFYGDINISHGEKVANIINVFVRQHVEL